MAGYRQFMTDYAWWRRGQQQKHETDSPDESFSTWERQFQFQFSRRWFEFTDAERLMLGTLAGLVVTAALAALTARILVAKVFGSAGWFEPTMSWYVVSAVGAVVGAWVFYRWPALPHSGKRNTAAMLTAFLLLPGLGSYIAADNNHLNYNAFHQLAELGGRSVCQIQLPDLGNGWPAGTYWMLNRPSMPGNPITNRGGDPTWLHRSPGPMVCL